MSASGWTNDTLKSLMDERDIRYSERFEAQQQAIKVSEANAEKWRASANEWRDAMNDRERNFVRKGENTWLLTAMITAIAGIGLLVTLSGHWK